MKQIKSTKAALGEIPSDVFLDASSTLAISTKKTGLKEKSFRLFNCKGSKASRAKKDFLIFFYVASEHVHDYL